MRLSRLVSPLSSRRCRYGALLLALTSVWSPSQADEWTNLQGLVDRGARVTAVAIDLDSGKPLALLNPNERLSPASLSKVVTAAAVLQTWNANEQFNTQVLAGGPVKDGILHGDLILKGSGDASLDGSHLWTLAAQILRSGIRSISGDLRMLPYPFGQMGCETKDRCDSIARSDRSYAAMLSSIGIDYGNWCIEVRPTAVGAPADITACHAANLPISVDGSVRTVTSGDKQTFWVERINDGGLDSLRVRGNIPQGRGQRLYRSMSDPTLGTGLMFAEILKEIGISLTGTVLIDDGALPRDSQELGTVQGLTVREQLGRMLQHSNNFIADVLTLNLASVVYGKSPESLAEASDVLTRFVLDANNETVKPGPTLLYSGSGLTPNSEMSAAELVGVLSHMYADTVNFPAFYGGLIVPRQGPYAFIRRGGTDWRDRVALKTGTMTEPYSVSGLSGYLRKKNGGWIAFTTIVNGSPRWKRVPLSLAIQAARGDIEMLLEKY